MESIVTDSFLNMVRTYESLLQVFYPARGATGFTESNQVHIYVNSLIESLDDPSAISWLEFPWEDKMQHIDAFVYSPKYKTVFYIEAKRLSISQKKDEIINDIARIVNADRVFLTEHSIENIENEYVIALSDVWLETKWKKSMPEWWCGFDNVPKQLLEWEAEPNNKLVKPLSVLENELTVADWSTACKHAHWLGEACKKVPNYCLLMANLKI
ncbi:hypothetical protein [Shewanella nanhaiensis]|uniref:Uncharacterized protein n=1 Tax=Shewanella nanhaiensis TaxID=2864872 RepID=A0ABS7E760_9GAMM|nr:hypothetical protein [Shewanella nanhaiensis]MBW8185507.1 hypothetical protein [Shewanella nanhaiensis]